MPFPFTLMGNTYNASDFSTPGYDEKITSILTDLFISASPTLQDLELVSFDFALSSWTIDIGHNNWSVPGEILLIKTISNAGGVYVFVRVDSVSGSNLTVSAAANYYRYGTTTEVGIRVIKHTVENPVSLSFEDHSALISSSAVCEDFISAGVVLFPGDYAPGGSVADSLVANIFSTQTPQVDGFVPSGGSSYIVSTGDEGYKYPGRGWTRLFNQGPLGYLGLYFNSRTNSSRYQTCFLLDTEEYTSSTEVVIGLQGYPNTGTPASPIGYPHELMDTGKAAYGPALVFTRSGDTLTVTSSYGATAGTVYTLPEEATYLPLSVEIMKVSGVFQFRVGTPSQFAILQGTFPTPGVVHRPTANRPYLSIDQGTLLVDYLWACD